MIATLPLGMLGELPSFKRECPEFAENIHWYIKHAEENNIHLGETIVDPQGFRSRAAGTAPETTPPERATARIVKEDSTGIWISGVKGVGTAVPQANELDPRARSTRRSTRRASGSTCRSTPRA